MKITALITGASSGIGHALAIELVGRGYDLGLAARRLDALQQLEQEIRQRHPDRGIELRRLDVTDYDQVPTAIDELATALGGLDVVIANAGRRKHRTDRPRPRPSRPRGDRNESARRHGHD
jgi:NADP-dependent 3-hydroxy acid dehydrogenase YdfG